MRPLLLRGALAFQTEEFTEKQAFQKNQNAEKTVEYLLGELENRYRNAEIASLHGIVNILISKKGTVTIKEKKVGVKGQRIGRYRWQQVMCRKLESRCRRRVMQM